MRTKRFGVIFIPIFAALVAFLIVANYYFFNLSRRYYELFNRTRLDPLGLDAFAHPSEPVAGHDAGSVRVVFFGDSRVAEWPMPDIDGHQFINRGINSHTSNQLLLRYDAHIRNLNPHILVLQICINDLYTIPLFNDSYQKVIEACKLNIEQIVQNAREQDATVIISTIFPVGQVPLAGRLFWSDEIPVALEDAVDAGTVRVIDLQFVAKEAQGNVTAAEMTGLSPDEEIEQANPFRLQTKAVAASPTVPPSINNCDADQKTNFP